MLNGQPGSLQTGDVVYCRVQPIVGEAARAPFHAALVLGAMAFVLHSWNEIVPAQIHIGGNSDKILAKVGENGHGRHCFWRKVKEMESINGLDRLEQIRERGTKATNEISAEGSVRV